MVKNINIMCPNPLDGTSLYRAMGVLPGLKRILQDEVSFGSAPSTDWSTLGLIDAMFIQRPYTNDHVQVALMTGMNRKKLWIDFDDDLTTVPNSNPASRAYNNDQIQKNIRAISTMAQLITVSTEQLKQNLLPLNPNVHVVPNCAPFDRITPRSYSERRNPIVLWRGSPTHDKDLFYVTDQLVNLSYKFQQWQFTFIGNPFWLTIEAMNQKNTLATNHVDIIEYFDVIQAIKPAVMIVPLHDCAFNRSKSNIAWLEASYAGAVTLAPDWPEWDKPGVLKYKNPEEFEAQLTRVLSGQVDLPTLVNQSWEYIQEHLCLEQANQRRAALIRDLLA